MKDDDQGKPLESVQSMARGLAVIKAFDRSHPRMTLSEVARRTDLTRATARRFLHTLISLATPTPTGANSGSGQRFSNSAMRTCPA